LLPRPARDLEHLVERRLRAARGEVEVLRAALGVEARRDGDRLDERRLPAPVLADEERHLRVQRERPELADRGDREGIRVPARDLARVERDLEQEAALAGGTLLLPRHGERL